MPKVPRMLYIDAKIKCNLNVSFAFVSPMENFLVNVYIGAPMGVARV